MVFASLSVTASLARASTSVTGGPKATVAWAGYGGNAQHAAVSNTQPQPFHRIRWKTKVDLSQNNPKFLPVHYGSPMITADNTILVPTTISAKAGYRVVAYSGTNGARRWSLNTDWKPSRLANGFTSPLPAVLTPSTSLAVAGAGGTILMRSHANQAAGSVRRIAFYGAANWKAHRAAYDKAVAISTPLTAGPDGSIYFGFTVFGSTPNHLTSGIARIAPNGHGSWISASAAAGKDKTVNRVAFSCAPALSPDGKSVYITVTGGADGILVRLDATTLKSLGHVLLKDPTSGEPAMISPSSSASPTVGPDGDVYYGVLENPFPKHDDRGWLLHFNSTLTKAKTPGSFGWDDTVSVMPTSATPWYHGQSSYLLVSKYNNYIHIGPDGNGHNQVAVLDPTASQKDPYASVQVMKAVRTVLSPVHVPHDPAGARYEWCINSAAVDTADDSVFVNSEAGIMYRWNLATNTLAEKIRLNGPLPEAYTPTIVGPDGTVYAINDANLYAIGS